MTDVMTIQKRLREEHKEKTCLSLIMTNKQIKEDAMKAFENYKKWKGLK